MPRFRSALTALPVQSLAGKRLAVHHGVSSTEWIVRRCAAGIVWYESAVTGRRYTMPWPELRYLIDNHSVEVKES